MRLPSLIAFCVLTTSALAGDAEIRAAQGSIEAQLRALRAGDNPLAYSYAAPNIQQLFPTIDTFMGMVSNGYQPVLGAKNFAFGKSEETAAGSITQQVLLVGPDGKDYEAIYTLELQPDGTFRITSVRIRVSNALST